MPDTIAVEWKWSAPEGSIEIQQGRLETLRIVRGTGSLAGTHFAFHEKGSCRLAIAISGANLHPGSNATILTVRTTAGPFSFFLRDVSQEHPILIPEYGVAVTEAGDRRSYEEIVEAIRTRGLQTSLQSLESQPEETFEAAAVHTRRLYCETWLGLSRDFRNFAVGFRGSGEDTGNCEMWDWAQPRFHGAGVPLPEAAETPVRYSFLLGRGFGCVHNLTRRLEEGVLPILTGKLVDEDIVYNFKTFVTLETSPLTRDTLRGTHFLVADGYGAGHMFTPEQEEAFRSLLPQEMERDEETVLYFRAEAVNTAPVPRYAWFKGVFPHSVAYTYEGSTGFGRYPSGRVFAISKLNGKPLCQEEIAILLRPGEAATFEFRLPHRPIPEKRAVGLSQQDFAARHRECREFWQEKLESAARVSLPEKRLDEMVRAGLLHLDLVAYGLEPQGTVAATIGVYCPIGSESSPIIQFMDSMGWHDLARRALMYFLDKQHEDGFIQNFGGYMLETGAALWSMGEHYRYTRDEAWLQEIAPKLLKACEYMIRWRERNRKEELRGRGYGMLDGKVADPEDPYHIFMLNGYAYLGLSRAAEMFSKRDPAQSERLAQEARALKGDIRDSFFEVIAKSPVVPLRDGTWCPTAAPWAEENRGPLCLFAEPGKWFTHGAFPARDSLVGPLYLVFQEVIDPQEEAAKWLANCHAELMCLRNVALSQPYYSRHPWIHLRRGEIKAFLKAYYNCFSGLADRETYTFWEHFFHASPHKTHEEGWFLMETRWMLYMEEGQTLRLLPGIPRAWLENGRRIELDRVATYFGPVSLHVESRLDRGQIVAKAGCASDRKPACVELRLPHPQGRKAVRAEGGAYDSYTETVRIEPFEGHAEVMLVF